MSFINVRENTFLSKSSEMSVFFTNLENQLCSLTYWIHDMLIKFIETGGNVEDLVSFNVFLPWKWNQMSMKFG